VMEAPVDVDYQDDIPECYRELSGRAKSDQGKHELSPLSPLRCVKGEEIRIAQWFEYLADWQLDPEFRILP